MNTMRQDVQRRPLPKRPDVPAERWSRWARSLGERHGRIALRHGLLAFTLAEGTRPISLRSQRWESYAWQLCPQINLAIGVVLRDTVRAGTSLLWSPPAQPELRHQIELRQAILPGDDGSDVRRQSRNGLGSHDRPHATGIEREQPPALRAISAMRSTPLGSVFSRLDPPGAVIPSHQHLSAPARLQLARRVVEARQRVEVKPPSTTVVRQQQRITTTEAERGMITAQSRMSTNAPAESEVGQSASLLPDWRSNARARADAWPAAPAINIEQLTEQVVRQLDHRLMAYRERRGKPA
jgi:hypothetical protein